MHAKREVLNLEVRCVRIDGFKNRHGLADDLIDAQEFNHGVNLNRDGKDDP